VSDPDWQADLARYPARPFLREQSIWPLWLYRRGRRMLEWRDGPLKSLAFKLYWLVYRIVETASGISLPLSAEIGPGLRIWHFGNVVIHGQVVMGANCTLHHGVTIGSRRARGPAPVLGDNVYVGAYAQILGDVRIGDHCKIGAMAVVLEDVPDGATAVGNPARIVNAEAEDVPVARSARLQEVARASFRS
jgi:serine O-acetyltransferase